MNFLMCIICLLFIVVILWFVEINLNIYRVEKLTSFGHYTNPKPKFVYSDSWLAILNLKIQPNSIFFSFLIWKTLLDLVNYFQIF